MPVEITIDGSGRVVIPKKVRQTHRLEAGSRLTLIDGDDGFMLVPHQEDPRLVEKHGLLVVAGPERIDIPDHRSLREERLDQQSSP